MYMVYYQFRVHFITLVLVENEVEEVVVEVVLVSVVEVRFMVFSQKPSLLGR